MYTPGCEKVWLYVSPWATFSDFHVPSSATMVCATLSMLVQIIVVPAGTVISAGLNAKFVIAIFVPLVVSCVAGGLFSGREVRVGVAMGAHAAKSNIRDRERTSLAF